MSFHGILLVIFINKMLCYDTQCRDIVIYSFTNIVLKLATVGSSPLHSSTKWVKAHWWCHVSSEASFPYQIGSYGQHCMLGVSSLKFHLIFSTPLSLRRPICLMWSLTYRVVTTVHKGETLNNSYSRTNSLMKFSVIVWIKATYKCYILPLMLGSQILIICIKYIYVCTLALTYIYLNQVIEAWFCIHTPVFYIPWNTICQGII